MNDIFLGVSIGLSLAVFVFSLTKIAFKRRGTIEQNRLNEEIDRLTREKQNVWRYHRLSKDIAKSAVEDQRK